MNRQTETSMAPFHAFTEAGMGEPLRTTMINQMTRFWEGQRQMLDEYEAFSRMLLERRREATEATLEALRKMSSSTDGADWAQCCSEWLAGSVKRVADDSRDMMMEGLKMMAGVSQAVTAGMAEAAKATVKTQEQSAKDQQTSARSAAAHGTAAGRQAARMTVPRASQQRRKEGARA